MVLTRSIRRKLLLTLVLVLVMVTTLTFSGVTGLRSYRYVVTDFDRILNKTPNRAHLAADIAAMLEPLRLPLAPDSSFFAARAAAQRTAFMKAWNQAEARRQQFLRRMDDLSPTELPVSQRVVINTLLFTMSEQMHSLRALEARLDRPEEHDATVRKMLETVSDLQLLAQKVPDPAAALDKTLEQARQESKSKLIVSYVVAVVAFVALLGLIRFGLVAILNPLRELHRGALRVAHGDFDFRVKLTTRDEMAELAAAFNEMTDRFQEIHGDLDRQVRERCQQLVRSERLANVGVLSAGVAHEINNPLSAISMASEAIADRIDPVLERMDPGESAVIRQYLKMIQDESVRCRNITARLLDFSRGEDNVREPTDLTHLVEEVLAMVQHLSKFRERQVSFEPHGPCFAEVNGAEIKQVVLNLIANGLEAMASGGTLRVRILEQTDHVRLEFQDEGCGMTPETIERIFEPFFTRKQTGQGTGLGLSITHRIVHQHGGSIDVRSTGLGQGSTFCVRLPRRAAQRGAA